EHWPLVVAFLVGIFSGGPFPILQFFAETGSAKTSALKALRMLVDPANPEHRALPKDEQNMVIAAMSSFVLAYDNVSRIEQWLSDAFCRMSTGGGFGTRRLYTDDEEQTFNVRRPVIITSINEVATSGDLLSRSLVVPLPRIEKYKSEKLLDAYF